LIKEFNRPDPPARKHPYEDPKWHTRPATGAEVMDLLDTFVAGTDDEKEKQAVRRAMGTVREVLGARLPPPISSFQPTFSVVGLVPDNLHRILGISRKTDHQDMGLPGGKIEPGESPLQALKRELREELGIEVLEAEPIFEHLDRVEGGESRPCMCFLVKKFRGIPTSQEGQRVEYVDPAVLLSSRCTFRQYNLKLFQAVGHRLGFANGFLISLSLSR
jgi:mutator protein MutT